MNAPFFLSLLVASLALFTVADRPHDKAVAGPVLVVRRAEGTPVPPPPSDDEDRAIALAVASIDPAARARILDLMRYTTARLEARLSPLGTDFDDDESDPVEEFERAMAAYMPSFNAARAFQRGTWRAADASARVARSCAEANVGPEETCVSLWKTESGNGELVARGRFLAWAAARAAVLDFQTPEAAEACARALRPRVSESLSTVALVLTADDFERHVAPEHAELQETARSLGIAMGANHVEDRLHLDAFARPAPVERASPWLALGRTALVVVPRLSSLSESNTFAAEIHAATAGVPFRWTHRP